MKTLIAVQLLPGHEDLKIHDLLNTLNPETETGLLFISFTQQPDSEPFKKESFKNYINCHSINIKESIGAGKLWKMIVKYACMYKYDFFTISNSNDINLLIKNYKNLLAPLISNEAEITFGKRQGLRKYKLLKYFQNFFFKKSINDYFSPVCFFKTALFQRIPYIWNSNNQFYSVELPIQVFYSNAQFCEVALEGSWQGVSGYSTHAVQTLIVFIKAYMHSLGIFYQRKYDCVFENTHYDLKLGYASSHSYAINSIKNGSKVIDIGAGPYGIASYLMDKNCTVVTVDMFDLPDANRKHQHIIADLNKNFNVPLQDYDYILFLDIIEHLLNPEEFLIKISEQFSYKKQKVILTTGNVAFFPLRLVLLLGFFNYGKSGILDRTHTRLYTFKSFKKIIRECNLKITKVKGIPAPFPKSIGDNFISRFLIAVNLFLIRISKSMFSYQIFIEAENTPSIEFLISQKTGNAKS